MSQTFSIELWSDVVCPFCYLGSRQLALALEEFEHRDEVTLSRHAFELDPNAPASIEASLDELVASKYAVSVEHARALHGRLEAQGRELDVTFCFERARPANSFDAHRLLALASSQGVGEEMGERLFRGYFCDGLLISDHDALVAMALEVGVLGAASLWESDAYALDVRTDESAARELGISGVPAILVDNKFMVLGAQGSEKLLDVLTRAWDRRT